MVFVIVDLEATCWEKSRGYRRMEIIEIGAVRMETPDGVPSAEFSEFVKPVAERRLTTFCTQLTSIRQADVDQADVFPVVFQRFLDWIGSDDYRLCSWGGYDLTQFRVDCDRHRVLFPTEFESHINLKTEFAAKFSVKSCGMKRALSLAGIPLVGTHHRGIDDARNIAKLARLILPTVMGLNE